MNQAPTARDLAAATARVSAVTDWIAAREGSSQPDPQTVAAAVAILATPPHHRDTWVNVHPATVHGVSGHLVAIYHLGTPGGPVAYAQCSCPSNNLCEHLLVALADHAATPAPQSGVNDESDSRTRP